MVKGLLVAAIGVAIVLGGIVYAKLDQFSTMGKAAESMVPPPETVTAMVVERAHWEQSIAATGTVSAVQGVTVSAELVGRVTHIGFESGATVKAGDVLVQLDKASEEARLASARASAALAQAALTRVRELSSRKMVSQEAVDSAEARVKETAAEVGNMLALIAKKTIRAPFAGRLGLRLVNLGQILREGDPIVSLQTLDPIHVDFSVPQHQLRRLKPGMAVRVSADTAPGDTFPGEVVAVSPEVDPATRDVRVRALVANRDEALHAGMFASVEVVLPETKSVLPVVATAVLYAPYGDSVFVVHRPDGQPGDSGQVLRQQFVRLGRARGDFVDVVDGLEAGATVVTSGVFKLRTGMAVLIDNTLAPRPELSPTPGAS